MFSLHSPSSHQISFVGWELGGGLSLSFVGWELGGGLSPSEPGIMKREVKGIYFVFISTLLCKDGRKESWFLVLVCYSYA